MSKLYYMQDKRQYVGNDVLWWAKDGKGYTTDITKAEVWTELEAFKQELSRSTDIPWPKDYVDARTKMVVDIQHLDRDIAFLDKNVDSKNEQA